ncbi:hypothetical protein N7468_005055 [Penicillium chermesinum]|uniref:Uncharacterized protein n=1 Tax=Penicillium chermesinum TaxID=63820 RepID=A0A9W9NYG3_9EURO|nr:uncharacterized protein N7468_005055 [Penicillium chermesinum]KAJ5232099.1 hypothetical protein N7468_005055 [Penicillium chermesinum]
MELSPINMYRTFATLWSFLVMGANDAAYGALIPYLETYYHLSYTIVSLIFLSPLVGYTLAAFFNQRIHTAFGQRGIALMGPGCHLLAYIVNCIHPPYPVLVISFVFAGFGNGVEDGAWNAWIGTWPMRTSSWGFFMDSMGECAWYYFYYIMVGCAAIELVTCTVCFWQATGADFRAKTAAEQNKGGLKDALLTMPSARVTWLCSLFLLGYVGVEVALGGWIVTFMIQIRHGAAFASGMVATGFWLGITVGRFILGFVTPPHRREDGYLTFGLVLWLVPQFYASAVAVSLQGFFLGPLFPGAVVMVTKLLPRHLHVSSIGFAAAFGGSGAAILPFAVGALAQAKGVQVLQPFIIGLSGAIFLAWIGLPRVSKAHRTE